MGVLQLVEVDGALTRALSGIFSCSACESVPVQALSSSLLVDVTITKTNARGAVAFHPSSYSSVVFFMSNSHTLFANGSWGRSLTSKNVGN